MSDESPSRSDDEELAMFLDGRLDPQSRARMIERLSTNAEERDVLAGTASILRETEEDQRECPTMTGTETEPQSNS